MEEDVSKKTVIVLLVLTIVISVVGTLIVLEEAQKIREVAESGISTGSAVHSSPDEGIIKLDVRRPPEPGGVQDG